MKLRLQATKPQADFHQMPHKFRLFAAGYGSGKSEAMAQAVIMDACVSSQALIGCYAPTYDLVRLITAARIQQKLSEHGVAYNYNKAENVIYTSSRNWGDIILRTMDNPERIVGYETYSSHLDELDTLKTNHAKEVWEKVIGRNRLQIKGGEHLINKASAYTTPEGFRFCHWRWVLNKTSDYGIVQAPSYSNPFLPPDYIETLRASYPANLVNAYIEGQFVNMTSGSVYTSYDRSICNSLESHDGREQIIVGMDFNVNMMAACVFVWRGDVLHQVDEIMKARDTDQVIHLLNERYGGCQIQVYPDQSGKASSSKGASLSDFALLKQAGFAIYAKGSNPLIKDRVISVNSALEKGKVKVNALRCPETARCLEQQSYDNNSMPDKTQGHDHANDAFGYPITALMPVKKPMARAAGVSR